MDVVKPPMDGARRVLVGCEAISDLKLLRVIAVLKTMESAMLPEEFLGCTDISTRLAIVALASKFGFQNAQ